MKRIIHISDLHFGRSKSHTTNAYKLLEYITDYHQHIPVVITGDITDSGTKGQYKKAHTWIKKLEWTNIVIPVPGNHDYAWLGNIYNPKSWGYYQETIGTPAWAAGPIMSNIGVGRVRFEHQGGIEFIILDSGDPRNKTFCARGIFTKKQQLKCEEILNTDTQDTRIVVLHHHPFEDGKYFQKLERSKELIKTIRNKCDILLFGHDHNLGVWYDMFNIPIIASSAKSTKRLSGHMLHINIIQFDTDPENCYYNHIIEAV